MSEPEEPPGYMDERPPLPEAEPPEAEAEPAPAFAPDAASPPPSPRPPPPREDAPAVRASLSGGAPRPARSDVPHDDMAEKAVIGAVFFDPSVLRDVGNMLKPEDFYRESHRALFATFLDLENTRQPIDGVTVRNRLLERGELDLVGGSSHIVELSRAAPTAANAPSYARIVKERSQQRLVLQFARSVERSARGEMEDVGRFVDEMVQEASKLSTGGIDQSVVPLADALQVALEQVENATKSKRGGAVTGVPSGFHALDKMTSGWQPSDLIILAARPGMGKTAFALNMLVNAAKDRYSPMPGVVFSLEMSKEQLATRLWCAETRVSLSALRDGSLATPAYERLFDGLTRMKDYPVFIDDTAALPIAEMMRKCRQLKHEHDIGIIMVDYLQLMTASAASQRASREQQISEISRNLKALAKELHVPVIALSQLNRGVESRTDKRPMLSDLRESGAIEQDADIIVFLYREDYYLQMKGEAPGGVELEAPRPAAQGASTTEVLIAKHRSGSTGRVELDFFAPYTLFANKHYDQPPPPDESTFRPRTDDAPVLSEDRDRPPPPGDDGGGLDDFEEFDEFEPGEPAGGP